MYKAALLIIRFSSYHREPYNTLVMCSLSSRIRTYTHLVTAEPNCNHSVWYLLG